MIKLCLRRFAKDIERMDELSRMYEGGNRLHGVLEALSWKLRRHRLLITPAMCSLSTGSRVTIKHSYLSDFEAFRRGKLTPDRDSG